MVLRNSVYKRRGSVDYCVMDTECILNLEILGLSDRSSLAPECTGLYNASRAPEFVIDDAAVGTDALMYSRVPSLYFATVRAVCGTWNCGKPQGIDGRFGTCSPASLTKQDAGAPSVTNVVDTRMASTITLPVAPRGSHTRPLVSYGVPSITNRPSGIASLSQEYRSILTRYTATWLHRPATGGYRS